MTEEELKQENNLETGKKEESDQPKKPGVFKRFGGWFYNPETKFGRFNRRMFKAFVVAVVFTVIGFALTYFFLFRPTFEALQAKNAEFDTVQSGYIQAQTELTAQYNEVTRLGSELLKANDQLAKEQNHMVLLRLVNDLMEANYHIAGSNFDSARTSLESARTRLSGLEFVMQTTDADLYTSLSGRLDQAISDLRIKSTNTAVDVTLIVNQLREYELKSFGPEK